MHTEDLIELTARDTGHDRADVERVIAALIEETQHALVQGDAVPWGRFGVLAAFGDAIHFAPAPGLLDDRAHDAAPSDDAPQGEVQ